MEWATVESLNEAREGALEGLKLLRSVNNLSWRSLFDLTQKEFDSNRTENARRVGNFCRWHLPCLITFVECGPTHEWYPFGETPSTSFIITERVLRTIERSTPAELIYPFGEKHHGDGPMEDLRRHYKSAHEVAILWAHEFACPHLFDRDSLEGIEERLCDSETERDAMHFLCSNFLLIGADDADLQQKIANEWRNALDFVESRNEQTAGRVPVAGVSTNGVSVLESVTFVKKQIHNYADSLGTKHDNSPEIPYDIKSDETVRAECQRLAIFVRNNLGQYDAKKLLEIARGDTVEEHQHEDLFIYYYTVSSDAEDVLDAIELAALDQDSIADEIAIGVGELSPANSNSSVNQLEQLVETIANRMNGSDLEVLQALKELGDKPSTNAEIAQAIPGELTANNLKPRTGGLFRFGLLDKGSDGKGFKFSELGEAVSTKVSTQERTEVITD